MKCAALVVLLSAAATCSAAAAAAAPDQLGRVKRLTTFSKPQESAPTIGTRECKSPEDCTIKGTTCTEDRRDTRRRCICEDGNPPINGRCPNRKRVRRGYLPTGNKRPYTELPPLFMPVAATTISFFPQLATPAPPQRRLFTPSSFPLGLKEKCNRDDDCIPQAHCVINTTIHKTNKVCLCEPDVEEVDNMCGGSERIVEAGSFLLAMGMAAYLLDRRP